MKLSEIRKMSQYLTSQEESTAVPYSLELMMKLGLEPGTFYQELEMESPYVDTHQDISDSNTHLQFHSHTFYEMLCCRNACGAEYLVGAERYKLQRGDIIFVPPGISHRPLLPDQMAESYIRDVLWISVDFFHMLSKTTQEELGAKFQEPFLFRTAGTEWEYICEMIRNGVREAESGQFGWSTLVVSNTVHVLVHLSRARLNNAKPMAAEKPELLDQVLAYVESHLSERISLAETAHHFYISESTISQTFRKKMDVSFYRYVTQRRLIASKALIEHGLPLEAVAEQIGFTDYSTFYRAFRQEYGISPRQYRKKQNG